MDNIGLGRFLGFINALVLALFAYMGTELIGVTVGEAKVRSPSCDLCALNTRSLTPSVEPPKDCPFGHPKDFLPNSILLHLGCSDRRYGR